MTNHLNIIISLRFEYARSTWISRGSCFLISSYLSSDGTSNIITSQVKARGKGGREGGRRRPVPPPVGTAQGDGGEDPEPSKSSLLCLIDGFGTLQLTVFKQ